MGLCLYHRWLIFLTLGFTIPSSLGNTSEYWCWQEGRVWSSGLEIR